jgi:hypothetical protein
MYNSVIPWLYQLTFVTPYWWTSVHIPVFVDLSSCCFIVFTNFRLDFGTVKMLPKELSETINRSRTENAMVKRKETKEQTTIYKRSHRILKIEQHEPHQKIRSELRCSGRVISSCSTFDTRSVTFVTNLVICHEWRTYWIVFTTNGTYTWSLGT